MKICAISDLHGNLPSLPICDLLLIAGDVCPTWCHKPLNQLRWLVAEFEPWLRRQPVGETVLTPGNHDWIWEKMPDLVPSGLASLTLIDKGRVCGGLNVWATPWQLRFLDWAFNLDEPELAR